MQLYRIVGPRPGTVIHTEHGWIEPDENGVARLNPAKKRAIEALGYTAEHVKEYVEPEKPADPEAQGRIEANRLANGAIAASADGGVGDHARRGAAARRKPAEGDK